MRLLQRVLTYRRIISISVSIMLMVSCLVAIYGAVEQQSLSDFLAYGNLGESNATMGSSGSFLGQSGSGPEDDGGSLEDSGEPVVSFTDGVGIMPLGLGLSDPGVVAVKDEAELTAAIVADSDKIIVIVPENGGSSIQLSDTIQLPDDQLILGAQTPVTIYSAPGKRHFSYSGGSGYANLTFFGIILDGGGNGGGMEIDDAMVELGGPTADDPDLSDYAGQSATFQNCAASGNGGAVHVGDSGMLLVYNGSFVGNHAGGDGGGLYAAPGANVTFTPYEGAHIVVQGNTATNGGGAYAASSGYLYFELDNNGTVTLADNIASGKGGGFCIDGVPGEYTGMELRASEGGLNITGNQAAYGGGVYTNSISGFRPYAGRGTITITGNSASAHGGGWYLANLGADYYPAFESDYDGGSNEGLFSISGNTAGGNGGGIYAEASADGVGRSLKFRGPLRVDGNGAGLNGGGIYLDESWQFYQEQYNYVTSISGNTAQSGGGIYLAGPYGEDPILGGGYGNQFEIMGPLLVSGNQATAGDGGGIYFAGMKQFADDAWVSFSDQITFHGNTASGNGGGLYLSRLPENTDSIRSIFTENKAAYGGGIYLNITSGNESHEISDSRFEKNVAVRDGGAIWLEHTDLNVLKQLRVENVEFKDNDASTGFFMEDPAHIAVHDDQVRNSTFTGLYAYGYNNCDIAYRGGRPAKVPTLDYDANGGTGTPYATESYIPFDLVTVKSNPFTNTGFDFDSWNTATDGSGTTYSPADTFTILVSTTLYAQWKPTAPVVTYTVTYNVNGGTGTVPTDTNSYNSGETVTVGDDSGISRSGYTFAGWNTQASGTGTTHQPGDTFAITGNTTLYAQWVPQTQTHTLTYNANGGTGSDVVETPGDGETVTVLAGNTFSRTGYNFLAWNTEANGSGTSYQPGSSLTVTGDLTLYAQWTTSQVYTVTYKANGGTGNDIREIYADSATVTLRGAGTYSRSGHTFAGWNTAAGGTGTGYNPGDTFQISGDITFHAQWSRDQAFFKVVYHLNGGSGTAPTDDNSYQSGDTVTVRDDSGISRSGHTFMGWNTQANGGGTPYQPGNTFAITGNTTLYAIWTNNGGGGSSGGGGGSGGGFDKRVPGGDGNNFSQFTGGDPSGGGSGGTGMIFDLTDPDVPTTNQYVTIPYLDIPMTGDARHISTVLFAMVSASAAIWLLSNPKEKRRKD